MKQVPSAVAQTTITEEKWNEILPILEGKIDDLTCFFQHMFGNKGKA